jgi:acyl transferase domain-containing protein/acyl-CoA synthetase (AMP-forming)/AMP-acid ligase II/NADPH:quinone reductase-like Zn-dependent oxidoreductase/NADP-dependent 3-hydroxy acid dehydrogenase YdfG/acyl carrier protein
MRDIVGPNCRCNSIVEILRHRSKSEAERLAFIFLSQDGTELCRFDYKRLDQRVRAIAACLQQEEVVGQRVLIAVPSGPHYVASFYACLYAGAIPVPIYPPASERGHARLKAIATNSDSTLGLTTSSALGRIKSFSLTAGANSSRWVAVDEIPYAAAEDWRELDTDPNSLAFLQYTSGSTGDPKGVMVSHRSLLSHLQAIALKFGLADDSIGMGWLPPFHDMGLVAFVLQPVFSRVPSVVLPPAAFLQKPVRWLKAISDYKATCSGGPNFAYDLCVEKISADQKSDLDLSHWTKAFCGAEPVDAATWRRFSEAFESCGFRRGGFYPCYGLAESIVMVSGANRRTEPASIKVERSALSAGMTARSVENGHELLGCGGPLEDHRILIVDPTTRELQHAGKIGEIWVGGPSLADGYWGDDALTREIFQAHLANDDDNSFLRTGDLGFLSEDNELFVAGRIKDVIIVRGRNIYPHDVERAALHSHDAFRTRHAAAFSVDANGSEGLGVVLEVGARTAFDLDDAIAKARGAITEECGVDPSIIVIVREGSILLTSSGKVRRSACKQAWSEGRLRVILQRDARNNVTTPGSEHSLASADIGEDRSTCGSLQADEIETWLIEQIAERLGVAPSRIDIDAPLSNHGLGSIEAVELAAGLEVLLRRQISATIAWEHPTIASLAAHLAGKEVGTEGSLAEPQVSASEPIAIIGMGCRFPQCDGPEEFWRLLCSETDPIQETPRDRETLHKSCASSLSRAVPQTGGFLDGVDKFDAAFFSISPREARYVDPQQRLLLEVAWHTLEDAAVSPRTLAGKRGGVYIGVSSNDYGSLQFADTENISAYSGTGCAHSVAANRLSYFFDWRGPSVAVDTACSSSLVAIDLACKTLRSRECDIALAGGVNVILTPQLGIAFQDAHMMAADGRCKTFDSSADGYVRSEGCGLVALKRLSDAQAAGDRIIAIIRGSAQNQDGRSNGLTAPSGRAQQNVISAALADARVEPERVGFVETHGTGTPLGDPIEVRAIAAALKADRSGPTVFLGAVKTNIGHLEAAAGVAGLIKTALCLSHQEIPANLHFSHLNPHINLEKGRLRVADHRIFWGSEASPRVAGVSSFGFGGANAHVVLEEAPEILSCAADAPVSILPISARDRGGLEKLASSYADFIEKNPDIRLTDICFTAAVGRAHFNHRFSLVVSDKTQMMRQLRAFCASDSGADADNGCESEWRYRIASDRPPRVTFLFSDSLVGVGRMTAQLYAEQAVFRSAFDQCRNALVRWAGVKWPDGFESDLAAAFREAAAPPLLTALQYALATMWRGWGIEPTTILARGFGQFAAACVSESVSIEDAIRLAAASSPQELSEALGPITFKPPGRGIFKSTESAQGAAEIALPDYLFGEKQHAGAPNRSDHISDGDFVVEIGVGAKTISAGESPWRGLTSGKTKAQKEHFLYSALSELYVLGIDPIWMECFAQFEPKRVSVPCYPFNRQSYWLTSPASRHVDGSAGATIDPRSLHPLLDRRIATDDAGAVYEKSLRPSTEPLVADHRVWGRALFPAAAFVEAALAAARYSTGVPSPTLTNVVIARPLVWEQDEAKTIHVNITSPAQDPNLHQLRICGDSAIGSFGGGSRTETMRLEIQRRGLLDSLAMRPALRRAPGPGEIEIEVRAAGLNFMDVMNSMDLLPCEGGGVLPALGAECSGIISAVGSGVHGFAPGHSVMAIAPGSFSGFVTTSATLAAHKPAALDFEQSAGTPIAFLTAYYALVRLGRLCAGEWVLIHSAAGGVGLAAVQIARKLGARVIATVGNSEKHEVLRTIGVEFIAESRGLSFAERVREWTNGRGVDVVLNSLSGVSIEASLSALAPYGRFLEIGKTDIYRDAALRLFPFRQNLSYFAIDLDRMCRERPALIGELLTELAKRFEDGWLVPAPHKSWPIERAAEAFRHIASRKNIGKIVLCLSKGSGKTTSEGHPTGDYAHAKVLTHCDDLRLDAFDAAAILRRCSARRSGAEIYERFARAGLEYGPSFQGVDWVQYNDQEMLAQIRLTSAAMACKGHLLPPALLDSALQAFGAAFLDLGEESVGDALFVPVAFERIHCHRAPPSVIYCHAIRRSADRETLQGDLRLATQSGEIVALAQGVILRRITRAAIFTKTRWPERPASMAVRALASNWLHRIVWKEQRLGPARSWRPGATLLLEPPGELCELVLARLQSLGGECIRVRPGEGFADLGARGFVVNPNSLDDFVRLLDVLVSTGRAPNRVVHMWTCAPPMEDCGSMDELDRRLRLGAHSLLFLVKAMAKMVDAEATFVIASANSQATDGDAQICPERAPVWAITSTIPKEFARFSCRGVDFDLSADSPMVVAQGIIEELTADNGQEPLVLRRGALRLTSELRPAPTTSNNTIEFRPGDVIILAGGRSGVGLALASFIAEQAAVRFAFVSRSSANLQSDSAQAIARLEKLGCEIMTFAADVADLAAMREVTSALRARWGRIDGVLHCAGVLRDGLINSIDGDWFDAPLRPKIHGAWALDQATRGDDLRFFIFASSMAAIVAPAGQCNHAAANAFEDAFAHHLARRGRRALSINWGPWGETGVIANERYLRLLRAQGVHPFSTEEAIAGFAAAIRTGLTQASVYAMEEEHQWGAVSDDSAAIRVSQTGGTAVETLAHRIAERAAALRTDFGIDRYATLTKKIEKMSQEFVLSAMRDLGWDAPCDKQSSDSLAESLGVAPQHQKLFQRWGALISQAGGPLEAG